MKLQVKDLKYTIKVTFYNSTERIEMSSGDYYESKDGSVKFTLYPKEKQILFSVKDLASLSIDQLSQIIGFAKDKLNFGMEFGEDEDVDNFIHEEGG